MAKKKTKKKKSYAIKSCKKKCDKKCEREKAFGDPVPVKPSLSYVDGEVYPRLIFKSESLWTRIKKFLGLIP